MRELNGKAIEASDGFKRLSKTESSENFIANEAIARSLNES